MRLSISFVIAVAVLFASGLTTSPDLATAGSPAPCPAVAELPLGDLAEAQVLFHGKSLGNFQQAILDALGQAGPPPAGQVWTYNIVAAWIDPLDPAGPMYHVIINITGTAPAPAPGGGIK